MSLTPDADLTIVRRAYAKQIMAAANCRNDRVEAVFAAVPREAYLGAGPWLVFRWPSFSYQATPDADPVYVYTNDLIAILPERKLNNGQPSLHAHLINMAAPKQGEHIVHIGAGTGYYTAILAETVGASGSVTAIEYDAELAGRAAANLAASPNVTVIHGDGAAAEFADADVIYVNAGATHPADIWLDRLREGGRLILPLTTDGFATKTYRDQSYRGAVFLISRAGSKYPARWISPVAIYPCEGLRDAASEKALAEALSNGGWESVAELRRDNDVPQERCWLSAPGWCLIQDAPNFAPADSWAAMM